MADPFLDNQNVPAMRDVQNRDPRRSRGDSHLSYSATVLLLSGRGRASARGCILRKIKCNALAGLHHAISARKVANACVGTIDRMHDLQVGALVVAFSSVLVSAALLLSTWAVMPASATRATPIVMKMAANDAKRFKNAHENRAYRLVYA